MMSCVSFDRYKTTDQQPPTTQMLTRLLGANSAASARQLANRPIRAVCPCDRLKLRSHGTKASTRKVKPIWILLKQETVSGSGISWAICKYALRSRQITTPAPHHLFFTGPMMPFLPPSQQHQSTEGIALKQQNQRHDNTHKTGRRQHLCRILRVHKTHLPSKNCTKSLSPFLSRESTVCLSTLRRFSPGIKTLNSLKVRYTATNCPQHNVLMSK